MSSIRYDYFTDEELNEVLACLQDSDRYIIEGLKNRLIKEIAEEIEIRAGIIHQ